MKNSSRLESSNLTHSTPKELPTENFLPCTTSEDTVLEVEEHQSFQEPNQEVSLFRFIIQN
jgi:hypothetical protein